MEKVDQTCVICDEQLTAFIDNTKDYEYGVAWSSKLVRCPKCNLVTQMPSVKSEDIPKLYPSNYFVHSADSKKKGIYSLLKEKLDAKKINRLRSYLPQNGTAIEVGCGNGAFLRSLENHRPDLSLIGIDIVDPGVFDQSRVKFITGQLEATDIKDGSVDLLFFDDLLEHVENPVTFLETCHRILKPNGVITTQVGSYDKKPKQVEKWLDVFNENFGNTTLDRVYIPSFDCSWNFSSSINH